MTARSVTFCCNINIIYWQEERNRILDILVRICGSQVYPITFFTILFFLLVGFSWSRVELLLSIHNISLYFTESRTTMVLVVIVTYQSFNNTNIIHIMVGQKSTLSPSFHLFQPENLFEKYVRYTCTYTRRALKCHTEIYTHIWIWDHH